MAVMLMNDFDRKVEEFFKNYQDRGMKKWAGFFLSDHTLKINKDRAKRAVVYPKKETMSEEESSRLLFKAFSDHYFVRVQLKQVDDNGNYQADICGFVEGYEDTQIIISGQKVALHEINNVVLAE